MAQLQIDFPYKIDRPTKWLRGALHMHSVYSDGASTPRGLREIYEEAGCDFLAITDHDSIVSFGNEPMVLDLNVPPNNINTPPDFVALNGYEATREGTDINCIGGRTGEGGISRPMDDRQACIDKVLLEGGIAILNHPHVSGIHDAADLEPMRRLTGIEICNTGSMCVYGSIAAGLATDLWDQALDAGMRVWGFAADDYHADEMGPAATGWVMAQCEERSPIAILEALKAGRFYGSTGIVIREIGLQGETVHIETENAHLIRVVTKHGNTIQETEGPTADYTMTGDEGYVRVECWNDTQVFPDSVHLRFFTQMAWTQPIFVRR